MQVLWKVLCKPKFSLQKGSLPQLKVLINCTANIDPTKNIKGCKDFMLTVLHAYVIAAAKKILLECEFENATDLAKEIVVCYTSFITQ